MEAALGDHGCGMSPFFHNLIATAAAAGVPVKQTVLLVSCVIVVLFF